VTSLIKKNVNGHIYWYAVKCNRVNGKPRIVSQIYLGTAERITQVMTASGGRIPKIKSYLFGLPAALLLTAKDLKWIEIVNSHVKKKRVKGPSVGEYLLFLILGRASCPDRHPLSKDATENWFRESFLRFIWDTPYDLRSEFMRNQMKYIADPETIREIELDLSRRLLEVGLTPSTIFYDTTNFATEIQNGGEEIPRRGKSKSKRYDKNLVGLGLATSEENIPFMHEVYPGNEQDAHIFSEIIDTLTRRLETLKVDLSQLVLVFDRGNNSCPNVKDVIGTPDNPKMHVVGGLKRSQVKDLMVLSLERYEYLYTNSKGNKITGYRTTRRVFDQNFTIVMSYDPASARKQKHRYEEKKEKFLAGMIKLKQRYERKGKGKRMSADGARKEAAKLIPQDYSAIFKCEAYEDPKELRFWIVEENEMEIEASFGKQTIFTDMHRWSAEQIVRTYNRKYLIEDDFKWLNDELIVPMAPFYVWKDESIRVHAFLCVTGLLMLRYMLWKMKDLTAKLGLKGRRPLEELKRIRIALTKEEGKNAQWVVEEMTKEQAALFSCLCLDDVMRRLK
jgi:hypothetical protein